MKSMRGMAKMMMATPLKYSFLKSEVHPVKSLTHSGCWKPVNWESLSSILNIIKQGREGTNENTQAEASSL